MERKEIFDKVAEIVSERMDLDPTELTEETKFQDLRLDSLDTVALIMELEDRIDKEVDVDFEKGIKTIGDVVDFVEESLKSR